MVGCASIPGSSELATLFVYVIQLFSHAVAPPVVLVAQAAGLCLRPLGAAEQRHQSVRELRLGGRHSPLSRRSARSTIDVVTGCGRVSNLGIFYWIRS